MWSAAPRQRDHTGLMNNGICGILNSLSVPTTEANRLLVTDEGKYLGATPERGALMTVKLDFGELGSRDIPYIPENMLYIDYPIPDLKGVLQTAPPHAGKQGRARYPSAIPTRDHSPVRVPARPEGEQHFGLSEHECCSSG